MRRRTFLAAASATPLAKAITAEIRPPSQLGASTSTCSLHHRHGSFSSALAELEHYRDMGAAGAQIGVRSWTDPVVAKSTRSFVEAAGMYLEGQIRLPKDEPDIERFSAEVAAAKETGVEILRTVMLGGRRYETFNSIAAWNLHQEQSWRSLTLAEPVMGKHGVKLAIENHKDWRIDENIALLRRLSSEHVGVNLDTGNNIALLEDPMRVVEELAPYAITTHLKDMAIEEAQDGFLLAEVPLGEGFLDIPKVVETCRKARPGIRFNLEMITRDPLRIPCLTESYWTTFGEVRAQELAAALRMVRANQVEKPLPRVSGKDPAVQLALEDEHNRRSFEWAASHLV